MDTKSNDALKKTAENSQNRLNDCQLNHFISERKIQKESTCRQELIKNANIPLRHAAFGENHNPLWQAKLNGMKQTLGHGGIHAFCGPRGTGKTQMAVELIKFYCSSFFLSALYQPVIYFFMALKETYGQDGTTSEKAILTLYAKQSLLVLDECQERGNSDWEKMMFTCLIDQRYQNMKDTILITNQTPEMFSQSMSYSIIDRIIETGMIIPFNDLPSFRAS